MFLDARGDERALEVTWHHGEGIVVLSLWCGASCAGTLRLAADEVVAATAALSQASADRYAAGSRAAAS